MSTTERRPTEFIPEEDDPDEWIRENRELIEREANSDAPDAWVFQRLLDSLDEDCGEVSTEGDELGGASS